MKKTDVITNSNIQSGDVIVGLSSFGQAIYESEYNGGMGSNGLTSARHDVFAKYLSEKYPESYDSSVPESLVYSGSKKLTDTLADLSLDVGKLVLSPTRTYSPIIKEILEKYRCDIHGMIHCSGGAQTKVQRKEHVFWALCLTINEPNPLKKTSSPLDKEFLTSCINASTTACTSTLSTPILSEIELTISNFVIIISI